MKNESKAIDEKIFDYLPQLNLKHKRTILKVVEAFAEEQKDWWDEISLDQQKAIDKSLAEIKTGKLRLHKEVMNKYKE